jgi:alpha-mannosidase
MDAKASVAAVLACGLLLGVSVCWAEGPTSPQGTFWVIPHTHWEGAVFKTREETWRWDCLISLRRFTC